MDKSAHTFDRLRIGPTIQQGGTQTIQQSIYITHDNPCGINKLIFQKMGYSGIRFIDLKNYLDDILESEPMKMLFEEVRVNGTDFINSPLDVQKQNKYLYSMSQWAQTGLANLPISPTFYTGYRFSFSVYDGSGCLIFGSNTPTLKIISESGGLYTRNNVSLISNASFNTNGPTTLPLYKLCNNYIFLPYLNISNSQSVAVKNSDFVINQLALPETIMAVASLLVDSANTRTYGVPKYGFSNRSNQLQTGGIAYYCAQVLDIYTTPDENGETTLIETLFARLALEEYADPALLALETMETGIVAHNIQQDQIDQEQTEQLSVEEEQTQTEIEENLPNSVNYTSPKLKLLDMMYDLKDEMKDLLIL